MKMGLTRTLAAFALVSLLLAPIVFPAFADVITGEVIAVHDGDTAWLVGIAGRGAGPTVGMAA